MLNTRDLAAAAAVAAAAAAANGSPGASNGSLAVASSHGNQPQQVAAGPDRPVAQQRGPGRYTPPHRNLLRLAAVIEVVIPNLVHDLRSATTTTPRSFHPCLDQG
ncbi:hypothetical protein DFJ73DRAFT_760682 [Zopfochytrium polystomum]|nr:hypothetical protein DFJ73DRAFT_760682 [Zopfochytrium polystomum]